MSKRDLDEVYLPRSRVPFAVDTCWHGVPNIWARLARTSTASRARRWTQLFYHRRITANKFSEIRAIGWLLWHSDFTKFHFGRGSAPNPAVGN